MKTEQLQLVTYYQSQRLYKLGFNWNVDNYYATIGSDRSAFRCHKSIDVNGLYKDRLSAPTVALALKWCRDVRCCVNGIEYYVEQTATTQHRYSYSGSARDIEGIYMRVDNMGTYEQAESALLDEILTITENQNQ